MLGRYDEAHAKISEALARRRKTGDARSIATSLSRLGEVHAARGDYVGAFASHREALDLRISIGDRWGQAVTRNNLAAVAFDRGDIGAARTGWTAALAEAEGIGALPLTALVLTNLGELAIATNAYEEARRRLDNALEIIDDIEDRALESECCRHLAAVEVEAGRLAEARALADRALAAARKAGQREDEARSQITLGNVLSANLYDAATDSMAGAASGAYAQAVDILRSIHHDAALGKALLAFGRHKAENGDVQEGRKLVREALAIFQKLGLEGPSQQCTEVLGDLS
jgi:tetratricopeptide (TPR) repeat protein